jgi:WD40 repeat protein
MNTKLNQIQHRLAIGNEQERLAALAELLECGQQGFDCFMEHSLKDKSDKVQQSAYWFLHDYNPYLKSSTEEGSKIHPTDTITCLAISPNNKIIVGGTWQKIWVWDLQTGEILYSLFGHFHWVLSVAISPDGNTLVSGSADQTIKIWNLTNGKLTKTLNGHSSWVNAVSISKDGNTLVSGSSDKTIKTWNLQSCQLKKTIQEESNLSSVLCLAISHDNKVIVGGCTNNKIVLCDLETGNIIRTLEGHNNWVQKIIITSENQQLISAARNGEIKFWQVVSNSTNNSYKLNRRTVFIQGVIDIVTIGLCVIMANKARTFFDYSPYSSNQLLSILVKSIADISASVIFILGAVRGRAIFGILDDSSSTQLPIQSLESIRTDKYELPIYDLNDYPLNNNIFIFCNGKTIKVYSRNESKIISTMSEESGFIGTVTISFDGNIIASAGNNWLRLWNFNTGKPLHPLKGLSYPRLSEIIIIQSSQEIFFRESHLFTVKGLDQNKIEIDIDMNQVKWEATGGYIERGLFTARRQEGNFEIKAIFGIFEAYLPIKIIEPPRITQLILYTTSLTIEFGQSQKIIGQILDQRGNIMPNETIPWTEIAGGEIDKDGYFKAGYVAGNFELIAVVGSIRNIVNVQIIQPPKLSQLVMVSSTVNLFVKESFYFVVKGIDQYGNDITISQVNWKASQGIIDNQGLYTAGNQEEKVIIQASVGDISTFVEVEIREPSRLTRIEISPSSMILLPGKSCYFSIKGYDQRDEEMSVNDITWKTTDGLINEYGNFYTFDYQKGICEISANVGSLIATAEVNVPVVLKHLEISPQKIELEPEEQYQFTLNAFDQRNDSLDIQGVTWKTTGGIINNNGVFQGDYSSSEITITATSDNIIVNAKVIILPVLISLKISPNILYLHPYETQLFKIKGTDQYGNDITISQVNWKASQGIIDNQGLYTAGNQEEKVIIQASVGDISTFVEVEIREPSRLTRMEISPSSMILLPGKSCYFSIKGYDQRDEEMSVNDITWKTTDGLINEYGNFYTFDYQKGICEISANVGSLIATAEVNVPVVLKHLEISPQKIELEPEEQYQFTLNAFDQTGELLNPEKVIWKTTKGGSINESGLLEVDYNTEPEITISAIIDNRSVNAKVIILPVLRRLEITPNFVYLKPGKEQLFIVKGLDQFGKEIDPGEIYWQTTGGKIDQNGNFIIITENNQDITNSKVIVTSNSVFKYSRKKRDFFLVLGIINLMLFRLISYEKIINGVLNPNIEAIDVDSLNSEYPTSDTDENPLIANFSRIVLIIFGEISDFLEGRIVKKSQRVLSKFFKSLSLFFFNEASAKLSTYANVSVSQVEENPYKDFECLQIVEHHSHWGSSVDKNPYKDFECLQIVEHHSHWVSSLAITPDGQKLISASWDKTIRIFNLNTYQVIDVLKNHTDDVECIAITPDGQEIISAGWDDAITFWDLNTGCLINTYDFSHRVVLLAVTPDRQYLISGEFSQTLKIWCFKTKQIINVIKPRSVDNNYPFYWHKCITITPDSKRVILARKRIEVYDIYTGKLQNMIGRDLGWVYSLAITPDGGKLISSYDKKIIVWDLTTKSQNIMLVLNTYADRNIDLVITPDGERLVSCGLSNDNNPELDNKSFIEIWDLNNGERIHYIQEYTTEHNLIYCLAITPDGKRIVSGYQNGIIKVWKNPILNSEL